MFCRNIGLKSGKVEDAIILVFALRISCFSRAAKYISMPGTKNKTVPVLCTKTIWTRGCIFLSQWQKDSAFHHTTNHSLEMELLLTGVPRTPLPALAGVPEVAEQSVALSFSTMLLVPANICHIRQLPPLHLGPAAVTGRCEIYNNCNLLVE